MKSNRQINFYFRATGFIVVLLGISLSIFASNNFPKAYKNSGLSNEIQAGVQNSNHASFRSALGGSVNDLYFELGEDNDDDTKAHSLAFSCCTQIKSYNPHLVSGIYYIRGFLFYEKTPRFILYKNFKTFLS